MHVFEPLASLVVLILGGFLAASGWIAVQLEPLFIDITSQQPHGYLENDTTPHETNRETPETGDSRISALPSEYEYGGPIPRVLLDDPEYQQARVIDAVDTTTTSTTQNTRSLTDRVRGALVNVYCTLDTGDTRRATTGSGVVIDPRGVILTNAHVAQFLLLGEDANHSTNCTVRTGNPAVARYEAELLYISPAWIVNNAELVDDAAASGTGERDYALLYVTVALEGDVPAAFPSLTIDTDPLSRELAQTEIYAGGYPAEVFMREGPEASLVPRVGNTKVTNFYTFGGGQADLIAIGDSVVGEQGSSGGPVVNSEGSVIGLIVTRGDEAEDGERSLRALTLAYINRTIQEETGLDLQGTMQGDLARRSNVFKEALTPFLSAALSNAF